MKELKKLAQTFGLIPDLKLTFGLILALKLTPPGGEKNEILRKLKLIVCFKQKGNTNKFLLIQLTHA